MDAGLLIVWAGEGDAPSAVNVGNERIELPDEQREPFAHERAHVLVSLNMGWKVFIGRGE